MLTNEIKTLLDTIEREKTKIVTEHGGLAIKAASFQASKVFEITLNGLKKLHSLSIALDEETAAWIGISVLLDWQEKIGAVLQDSHNTGTPSIDDLGSVQRKLGDLIQEIEGKRNEGV